MFISLSSSNCSNLRSPFRSHRNMIHICNIKFIKSLRFVLYLDVEKKDKKVSFHYLAFIRLLKFNLCNLIHVYNFK